MKPKGALRAEKIKLKERRWHEVEDLDRWAMPCAYSRIENYCENSLCHR